MRRAKQIALTIAFLLAVSSSLRAQSRIPWVNSWQEASALAQRNQRLVLIHFWSNNCPPCVVLEQKVFNRPAVIRSMVSGYIPLKVNVDENAELARYYKVQQWPTDVIVTAEGAEVYRATSAQDPNRYIATLDQIAAHTRAHVPFAGSPSTDIAAASRDSGSRDRASAFPAGAATGSPVNPTPSTPSTQYNPFGGQRPAGAATTPAGREQATAAKSPARGGEFVTNQYSTGPGAASGVHDQQASFTASQSGQYQSLSTAPPYRGNVSPVSTANQFVSGGLGVPSPGTAPRGVAAAAPAVTDAPPGPPTLALEGYCCVKLVEQEKWVKGDPQWGAMHRGRTYLFSGPAEQKRFLANFDKYAPALSGYDCVQYGRRGALVDGKRAHGIFYHGQIFLFADEASLVQFWESPERYVPLVRAEQDRQAARQQ